MLKIAVDVGGTFTDTVAADDTGKLFVLKIRSTPAAESTFGMLVFI